MSIQIEGDPTVSTTNSGIKLEGDTVKDKDIMTQYGISFTKSPTTGETILLVGVPIDRDVSALSFV